MISTHVLDTSLGNPAGNVNVQLQKLNGTNWDDVDSGKTDTDGRFAFKCEKVPGTYRLVFEIGDYFKKHSREHFFLQAPVIFMIENTDRKYHVPLLLNPFGYSTYRGS